MASITCTICQAEVQEKFCPQCGQKVGEGETTLKSLGTDFLSNLFSLEKSVFAGIIKILINPKELIYNYWAGHRKYYPSPGKLLVYAIAIAAIHLTYVDPDILGLTFDLEEVEGQLIFWIIFFPILTATSYFSFLGLRYSFAKHLIAVGYIASSFFILCLIVNDILLFLNIDTDAIFFILFIIGVFIWNARVFSPKKGFLNILFYSFLELLVFTTIVFLMGGSLYLFFPGSLSQS